MNTEIRLRLNADCKSTFQNAANRHGVPLVHFITMAVHGYLRGIGDLNAIQSVPVTAAPVAATQKGLPVPPDLEWIDGVHTDADGEDWTMGELERAYSQGQDPLRYYD